MPDVVILIRGSGDVASAVAHRLFQKGYGVVIHDVPLPTATRRKMAFTDAIFDHQTELENIKAMRVDSTEELLQVLPAQRFIPVTTLEIDVVLRSLPPLILIDGRMRKHTLPEPQIHLAPLTIGLGPNFIAGENVHLAVETAWGDELGKVISYGATQPLAGEPQMIAGHARDRYVYSPHAGIFRTLYNIGDIVQQDQTIAFVEETPLSAPIKGVIRGLPHDGVPVEKGTKVIEVDPRLLEAQIAGLGPRPKRIAEGVCVAIQKWLEVRAE